MDNKTPAIDIKQKDRNRNRLAFHSCLRYLRDKEEADIKNVVDIRYGLGGWACSLFEFYPKCKLIGFEGDEATYSQAAEPRGTKLIHSYFPPAKKYKVSKLSNCDLLLADFNRLTVMNKSELTEALDLLSPRYAIFTDVSCSKLHLNYKSYWLESPSLDAYWSSFDVPNYRFLFYDRQHFHASTGLFRRTRK